MFGTLIDNFANGRNVIVLLLTLPALSWDTKVEVLLPDDWQFDQERTTDKANLRDILAHVSRH